jgi:hypothetical protein
MVQQRPERSDNEIIEAVAVADQEDLATIRGAADRLEVRIDENPSAGIEPVTTVTLLLLGSAAAVAAVQQVVDECRGGQVLDLRAEATRFAYRDRNLKYGLVVVRMPDGNVRIEVHEPRGALGQVLDALASVAAEVGKADAETFSVEARKAINADASITVTLDGGTDAG